ncbi:hypothetical protein [Brevibacillus porteri]|uniref:hypothetical protein n=1 Tax=Brevibacillus porteri TaxID=2126350 RepID=UPI002EAF6D40|nr:DUF2642 domain-containing protein [Bacillus thuringiensis]
MGFRDQVQKFQGRNVKVQTVDGTFFGRLAEVKSTTIILEERNGNRRTIIRDSKIVAVTEHDGDDC